MGKKCICCNADLNDNALFCHECGAKQVQEKGNQEFTERRQEKNNVHEPVKFSHQWLIPKIIFIGALCIDSVRLVIEEGIPNVLLNNDWVGFIAGLLVVMFFETWMSRNLLNYSGSEHLITFGITKEMFAKAERILKKVYYIASIIIGIIYVWHVLNNILFNYGLFTLMTYFMPAIELENLLLMEVGIDILYKISMTHRHVNKDDLEDDFENEENEVKDMLQNASGKFGNWLDKTIEKYETSEENSQDKHDVSVDEDKKL